MAETLVEAAICDACGTEVRGGSAFCFNCGESVVEEPAPPAILKPDQGLSGGRSTEADEYREPEPPPVAIPRDSLGSPRDAAPKTEKFPAAAQPTRQLPRKRVKKIAEVEWVERPSSSAAFIVTAVVLSLLAGLMIAIALYLR